MTLENLDKIIGSLWANSAIKDCYKNLEENKDADAYETLAGSLCSLDEKQEYQVKVIVTRKEDDFIGDFDHIKHTSSIPQFPKDREVIGDTC